MSLLRECGFVLAFSFFVFSPVASGESLTTKVTVSGEDFSVEKLPSGTRMVIPSEIMEEYQKEEGWGSPFNYLSNYYAVPAPSTLMKGEHTYYVPLKRVETTDTDRPGETVMMDLMNIQKDKNKENTFTTINDTYIIEIDGEENKKVFVAVNNAKLGICLFVSMVSRNRPVCYPSDFY